MPWRVTFAAVAIGLLSAAVSEANVEQYAGRIIVDLRVEVAGQITTETSILQVIETRVGEPFSMLAVRSTIDHLVGIGRFEDVRVEASSSTQGVALRWSLVPIRRIVLVTVNGGAGLSDSDVRTEMAERYGLQPSASRINDMVSAARSLYAEHGYRSAVITPRLVERNSPERLELVLDVVAGFRTTVAATKVQGNAGESTAALLRRLDLRPGRPFDGPALTARLASYEDDLRGLGYYEARLRETHEFAADGRSVNITLEIERGPRVRVVIAGDPLPDTQREALALIRQERQVDLDLLEDVGRGIEASLRRQGYRSAEATFVREARGAEVVLTFTVARGPLHRVGTVDVAGLSALARADIAPVLPLKTGEAFVDARVAAIATGLTELYRVRGFAQVSVKPDLQLLPPETDAGVSFRPVAVGFDIVEGPRTVVSAIRIEGASVFEEDRIRALLGLAAGRPFYRQQLSADRDAIEAAYRAQGFQRASATPQLTFEAGGSQVSIAWILVEGQQIHVDEVLITGNFRTNTALIRREMTLTPGSPLSDDALVENQRRIAALGLFRRVRLRELPRAGDATRDILVEVEETDPTTVSVGGGLEVGRRYRPGEVRGDASERLEIAPRGFFDISRRNLWGKNRSVTLFGRLTLRPRDPGAENTDPTDTGGYGFNDYRALFTFREPRALGTGGDAQLNAFVEQGVRSSFNFNRKGVSADYARHLNATVTVSGRYTFDYTKLFDTKILPEDQLLIDRLFPQVKLSKLFGAVLRDSRDDVLDPQRGAVIGLDGSVAARAMGSEVGFARTFVQGFWYRRLPGRGFVFAAGARLGLAAGFPREVPRVDESDQPLVGPDSSPIVDVVKDLPASERFFAGGDTTVRGFALDRLGTRETLDPQGFPQGGNGLVVLNAETRAPYWKDLQFVWFVDAGNVFKRANDIRLDELRVSSGFGVRYRSPIGPLRVDWGVKVSTRLLLTGGRESASVFHISLGQAF
ncbi:MAG: POTRA domain-containing protein [Vicinamibacterales bacterium]